MLSLDGRLNCSGACLIKANRQGELAGMHGADLFTEPPRENQNNCERDDVHKLCNHEDGIANDDRMRQKEA